MGAPVNTLAGMLVAAYFIYMLKHDQVRTLMGLLGLSNADSASNR